MKIVFELPFSSTTCGGVIATQALAKELGAKVKYQTDMRIRGYYEDCDWWITYSDNPHTIDIYSHSNIKHIAVYFQSYGMSYVNEYNNALISGWNFCTTKKIEQAILKDGFRVDNIGFGLNMDGFVNYGNERKNYLAILVHDMESKRTSLALQVADSLLKQGVIEGIITFGGKLHSKPKGLVRHYENATRQQVAEVFNQCKAYLMPSVSEGLNMTPIESTLCGCPAVICDGAIGEVFDETTCKAIVNPDDLLFMEYNIHGLMINFDGYSPLFERNMRERIKPYTWDKVANNLKELL
jgi:hypothetical protein